MAKQKEYKIIIDGIKESIEGIATLQESLDKLGAKVAESGGHFKAASQGMDELAKSEQKIKEYNEEYQTALQSNKMVLQDNAKEIKNKLEIEKAEFIVQEDLRNTYAQKQQLLSALGKVIKNTAGDTTELQQKYAELNQELKDFDASLGNHQRNVGDYGQATKNLKTSLRECQEELANMIANGISKADPKFVELAKKAGQLKDAMSDAGEEVSRFASDTKKIDDAINIAQSATAAFGLLKGTMSAFGIESEEAEKAIQKLAGAMSIIQSLKTLSETLQNGSATAKLFTAAMGLMTKGMQGASIGAKALRVALMSIGIGIIIALVSTLIEYWDELVGWFQKTFDPLNKLGTFFTNLKGVFVGFGKAIINFVINPLKTFAKVIERLFKLDFAGAWQAAQEGLRNQFQGTVEAFQSGFNHVQNSANQTFDEIAKNVNQTAEMVDKTIKDAKEKVAKETKYELDMLKAKKGAEAKYSEEGIRLQKKLFNERKKLAKGNADELKQIALEEAEFARECEEHKTAAVRNGVSNRTRIAKDEQKAEEEAKKAIEARQKAEEAYYRSIKALEIQNKENEVALAEAEVKRYSTGPIEKYKEAVEELNKLSKELVKAQNGLKFYDIFKEFENDFLPFTDQTADVVTRMEDFRNLLKMINDQMVKMGGENNLKNFEKAITSIGGYANLTKNEIMTLYHLFLDAFKVANTETKEFIADTRRVQEEQLKKERDDIEKTTIKFELENDKKSESAIKLVENLNAQWDAYLEHAKEVYGQDSKEYLKIYKERLQAAEALSRKTIKNQSPINRNESKTKEDDKNGGFGIDDSTNWDALWDEDSPVYENLAKLGDLLFENVLDPINEAFSAMLEFQIEEAQEALDKATELHDKSVERVQQSQEKISELNDKIRNSSGAQLEAYKQQQADEMLLMAQREAEESRLAREKERREKELERKQKKQKKLDLQMSLVEGIINTAVGVTKALTWGFPLGVAFAAIIGAMGAMQTALIAKQISKLADGGLLQGKSHEQGGIQVYDKNGNHTGYEVEGGEYVVNKRSTKKYLPLLQAINEEGARKKTVANQIGKMANGGQINYERIDSNMNSVDTNKVIEKTISQIDMHPQVSVVDINRGQKNLTQVRQMAGGRA